LLHKFLASALDEGRGSKVD